MLDLRTIVMKILSISPKHGYQLVKDIEKKLEKKVSLGGVYPILNELETKGIIIGHEMVQYGRFKKVYSLTEKGKKKLEEIELKFNKYKRFMES